MPFPIIMGVNVLSAALIMRWFVWPRLRLRSREEALVPLVAFHWIRSLGLLASLPAMTGEFHRSEWALGVAYGDLATIGLAWASVALLRARHPLAIPGVWIFNIVGLADIANSVRSALVLGVPVESVGPQALVVALGPPALIVTHAAIFMMLLRRWPSVAGGHHG